MQSPRQYCEKLESLKTLLDSPHVALSGWEYEFIESNAILMEELQEHADDSIFSQPIKLKIDEVYQKFEDYLD